ncbi:hypothetical protein B0J18DRAFT_291697 [Chaetomium sp. MPI-SDFR-AT-0129]|nr:hypothetical protein B0J18DRAFT_291697 [Chaetomium sp. MPI-SDFR-AT-0129]
MPYFHQVCALCGYQVMPAKPTGSVPWNSEFPWNSNSPVTMVTTYPPDNNTSAAGDDDHAQEQNAARAPISDNNEHGGTNNRVDSSNEGSYVTHTPEMELKRTGGGAMNVNINAGKGKEKAATTEEISELEDTLADLMRKINDIKLGSGLVDDENDNEEDKD